MLGSGRDCLDASPFLTPQGFNHVYHQVKGSAFPPVTGLSTSLPLPSRGLAPVKWLKPRAGGEETAWVLAVGQLSAHGRVRACRRACSVASVVSGSETPWTAVHQTPLSMGFSRQENCSALQFRSPGDLPDLGVDPASLMSPAFADSFFTTSAPWKAHAPFHRKFVLEL